MRTAQGWHAAVADGARCARCHVILWGAGTGVGRHKKWHFTPKNFREGQSISGGSIFGEVYENELMPVHSIMCPPKVFGTVTKVYGAGTDGHEEYDLTDPVRGRARR